MDGCKVTIYRDGPVKMVTTQANEPCSAPLPKDHQFHKETRTYEQDGCIVTEYISADGMREATMDCSNKDKIKK